MKGGGCGILQGWSPARGGELLQGEERGSQEAGKEGERAPRAVLFSQQHV